jgi:hypothetical protein
MPLLYAQKLNHLLEEQGSSLEISTTEEKRQVFKEYNKKLTNTGYPIFSGGHDFVYIEVKKEDLLVIKGELEKMGFPLFSPQSEGDFRPEYLCTKCNFKSDDKGFCPKHKTPLLEFSDWLAAKKRPAQVNWFLLMIFVAAIALYFWYTTKADHLVAPLFKFF